MRSSWCSETPDRYNWCFVTRIVKIDGTDRGSGMKRGRSTGTRSSDASTIRMGGRFTNAAVPRFGERANWEGLSQGLSGDYNSPGRLAVFRRQFESVTRRTGMDPATFATELDILVVRGFGDMGTCARNRMVRDRLIADQWSCGLRRHLDSVPPDTPIRDIVDRCQEWESHSEQKRGSAPGTGLDQGLSGMSGGGFTDSGARG